MPYVVEFDSTHTDEWQLIEGSETEDLEEAKENARGLQADGTLRGETYVVRNTETGLIDYVARDEGQYRTTQVPGEYEPQEATGEPGEGAEENPEAG